VRWDRLGLVPLLLLPLLLVVVPLRLVVPLLLVPPQPLVLVPQPLVLVTTMQKSFHHQIERYPICMESVQVVSHHGQSVSEFVLLTSDSLFGSVASSTAGTSSPAAARKARVSEIDSSNAASLQPSK
jgi:hypothetical protein